MFLPLVGSLEENPLAVKLLDNRQYIHIWIGTVQSPIKIRDSNDIVHCFRNVIQALLSSVFLYNFLLIVDYKIVQTILNIQYEDQGF